MSNERSMDISTIIRRLKETYHVGYKIPTTWVEEKAHDANYITIYLPVEDYNE